MTSLGRAEVRALLYNHPGTAEDWWRLPRIDCGCRLPTTAYTTHQKEEQHGLVHPSSL